MIHARPGHQGLCRTRVAAAVSGLLAVLGLLLVGAAPAGATGYVPISGDGSSWSAGALDQWIADVHADGIQVNYTSDGSTTGRQNFILGQNDFAASDIPFQTDPGDGSAPEHPQQGSYAYMPITAGGTVFMYNLKINGQRVTNLRLSGENLTKIFTGAINNWDDPALQADNPALKLPDQTIVPVVRSDGSGTSFELSEWMISQFPGLWNSYCQRAGRAPACGATSFYPTVSGMIAQNGDLGVSSYVSQAFANGSIGYVNYYYAITTGFPVALMLNADGYYTEPTPQNVAVSLLQDRVDTTDVNNPALYLTQQLSGVYTDPDPRTYPLSSYGYLILPTSTEKSFTTAKGLTLSAFADYSICQGQQQAAALGYSPMPANLVEAGFNQIAKIPGANLQYNNIQNCNNPTFASASGPNVNLLAQTAPYPPACDKQGPTQCTGGTGGATATATAVSGNPSAGVGAGGAAAGAAGAAGAGTSSKSGTKGAVPGAAGTTTTTSCDPTASNCSGGSGDGSAGSAGAQTATLAVSRGWSFTETLFVLIGLALLALILLPGLLLRRLDRSRSDE